MNSKLVCIFFICNMACGSNNRELVLDALPKLIKSSSDSVPVTVNTIDTQPRDFITMHFGNMTIEASSKLKSLDQRLLSLKYPFEDIKMIVAYGNDDGTVTLLVSPREEMADQKDLPSYQQKFTSNFANNPSIEFKR